MLITLLSWLIILFMAISIGSALIHCIAPASFIEASKFDVYIVMGIMCLNVYAQIYSIFSNVGKTAFCMIFVVAVFCMIFQLVYIVKKTVSKPNGNIQTWQICVAFVITMWTGLYTVKAPAFGDTYLYHTQAIRWIEEYGVVPGLGNLHTRFAYNSACMPLHALFSFNWFFEQPLHVVNGFLGCFFVSYALVTNKLFAKSESRLSDMLKWAIIVFVFVSRNNISSPGSDMPAMLIVLYVMCKWSECSENSEDSQSFGIICLFAAWAVSIKLSATACMMLLVYPAVMLIKEKRWKTILVDLVSGILIVVPWLVRNVIISGYLLYPYSGIDLFHFDWKMPVEVLDYDRKEIMVWGREVRDVSRFDESIVQWFGTWFSGQMLRNKVFIIAGFLATFILIILIVIKLTDKFRNRNSIMFFLSNISEWVLIVTMIISEGFWLFSAPLLRYGVVYLLMPTAVVVYLIKEFMGEYRFRRWAAIGMTFIVSLLFLRGDEDFRLITPHRYWKIDNVKVDWYGFEIYKTDQVTFLSGYDDFPVVTYERVLEDIVPRGDKLEDGFKVR